MRIRICAVGRIPPRDPEQALVEGYLKRAAGAGRRLKLGPFEAHEVDPRKHHGSDAEGTALRALVPGGAARIALDERGRLLSSTGLAAQLAAWRDRGHPAAAFLIGGANGLDPALREEADLVLSFGPMVWPHALARVMLAEQVYRATQILCGTPYHRA